MLLAPPGLMHLRSVIFVGCAWLKHSREYFGLCFFSNISMMLSNRASTDDRDVISLDFDENRRLIRILECPWRLEASFGAFNKFFIDAIKR